MSILTDGDSPPPIMKKILYKNQIVEVKEKNLNWLEQELKRTGETVDQALERIVIETNEQELAEEIEALYKRIRLPTQPRKVTTTKPRRSRQYNRKKPTPNTLDYYIRR